MSSSRGGRSGISSSRHTPDAGIVLLTPQDTPSASCAGKPTSTSDHNCKQPDKRSRSAQWAARSRCCCCMQTLAFSEKMLSRRVDKRSLHLSTGVCDSALPRELQACSPDSIQKSSATIAAEEHERGQRRVGKPSRRLTTSHRHRAGAGQGARLSAARGHQGVTCTRRPPFSDH